MYVSVCLARSLARSLSLPGRREWGRADVKGCKTAPPKPSSRRKRKTEKQPFYLSFVFSLPSTPPNTPLLSAQVFFSLSTAERVFLPFFLFLSVQLSHSNWKPGGVSLFLFFPSLFSSFFLLSYFSKRVLFAVGVSFENQVTPFFLLFFLSFFFLLSRKGEQRLSEAGERGSIRTAHGSGGPGSAWHKGGQGTPPRPHRGKHGTFSWEESRWGLGGRSRGCWLRVPSEVRAGAAEPAPPQPEVEGWVCSSLIYF